MGSHSKDKDKDKVKDKGKDRERARMKGWNRMIVGHLKFNLPAHTLVSVWERL
jgi:hypothetical protein